MNVKAAGALKHKCLHNVVKIFSAFKYEEVNSTVIAFGIVGRGGLTGL